MKVTKTILPGVSIIEPKICSDHRGFFIETFHVDLYREVGIGLTFIQDNHSQSTHGILRGLHFQRTRPQGKLVRCSSGVVYDVVVDVNPESETIGLYVGVELIDKPAIMPCTSTEYQLPVSRPKNSCLATSKLFENFSIEESSWFEDLADMISYLKSLGG